MIFLDRRRLIIWLLKAYVKKWKKTIFVFFGLGLVFFFAIYYLFTHVSSPISLIKERTIGILGTYNSSNLPNEVLSNVSFGLTQPGKDGKPLPSAARSWKIENNGKTYTFYLKENLRFSDGTLLTSKEINYNFENVQTLKPDKHTITFTLKESYSPFLITVARPIFKDTGKFIGLGRYKVKSLDLNGDFVEGIELQSVKGPQQKVFYQFYPTEDSLKTALVLGEVSETNDLSELYFKNTTLNKFSNYTINKKINYQKLATLFYNTQDKILSDKRLRQALSYAIPDSFLQGKRNYTPYPPIFWVDRGNSLSFVKDLEHSKLLLEQSAASSSAKLKLNIKTLPKYKKSAEEIKESWQKIGVSSSIELVDTLPSNFQIFLGEFYVSKDPDQYVLWHSEQPSNITKYKNLRIDKLLEDGRQTVDENLREKIYADFQKYLLDDSPASFLFFPYNYEVSKK